MQLGTYNGPMVEEYQWMVQKLPVRRVEIVELVIAAKEIKMTPMKQTKFTQKKSPDLIKLESLYTAGSVDPRHGPSNSHGFGHGVERRCGKLRLSGHPGAHQVGKK